MGGALFCMASVPAATLDPSGNYVIHYVGANGNDATYTFVPRNKVIVTITSSVTGGATLSYRYRVSNGRASRQGIEMLQLFTLPAGVTFDVPPNAAHGPPGFFFHVSKTPVGTLVRWNGIAALDSHAPPRRLQPGSSDQDFTLTMPALAGINPMRVFGYVPDPEPDGRAVSDASGRGEEFPDLDAELTELMDSVDFAQVYVAAPKLFFDASTGTTIGDSLAAFREELRTWVGIHQATKTFVDQGNARIDDILDALDRGDAGATRARVAAFRAFLAAQHASGVSRLGVTVIDANLQAILAALDVGPPGIDPRTSRPHPRSRP